MTNSIEDNDSIIATYNIFINPSLPPNQKLMVLQQFNRRAPDGRPFDSTPAEMRIKENSAMVEVDVPLNTMDSYDRDRGMQYGKVLAESQAVKSGGSLGLAGGFGVGAPPARASGVKRRDELMRSGGDWAEEARRGRVLQMQTLGGQEPNDKPVTYMVGVFQDDEIHFTPVKSFVHLRPQLHHIDALSQLDKAAAASSSSFSSTTKDSSTGPPTSGPNAPSAARAIHMTVKNAADGEGLITETMVDRLRGVQAERWRKLVYLDENSDESWDAYEETLLPLRNGPNAEAVEEGKGRTKGDKGKPDAVNKINEQFKELTTRWNDVRLLEAVSGEKRPVAVDESEAVKKGKQAIGRSQATAMELD